MSKFEDISFKVMVAFGYWCLFSFMGSLLTVTENTCDKTLRIEAILYTKAFCEVPTKEDNND